MIVVKIWLLYIVALKISTETFWSSSAFADTELFMLTSDLTTTPVTNNHAYILLANRAGDVVNEKGHFTVSDHLLNDVYRQQWCSVSSPNYSPLLRTLDWAHRCIIPCLMLVSLPALFAWAQPLGHAFLPKRKIQTVEVHWNSGLLFSYTTFCGWPQLYLTAHLAPGENRKGGVNIVCQLSVVPCCLPESPAGVRQRPVSRLPVCWSVARSLNDARSTCRAESRRGVRRGWLNMEMLSCSDTLGQWRKHRMLKRRMLNFFCIKIIHDIDVK